MDSWRIAIQFPADARDIYVLYTFTMALGSTQPPTQWVPGASLPEVRRLVLEADNWSTLSAENKNSELYLHSLIHHQGRMSVLHAA